MTAPVTRGDSVDQMVAEWTARSPDLDVSALEVIGRLFRSAEIGQRRIKAALQPLGLSYGDFDVLNTLRRRGDRDGTHPRVLAAATLITSGAMTARVDRLVDAGYVERRPDPDDGRSILIRLTRKGDNTARLALERVLAVDEELLAPLTPRRRTHLASELRQLLLAYEAH
jgi:DNA-binding MarR family transcriptional regulator